MYRALFTSWKVALLWVIGICASAAAFVADEGGQERLQVSAELGSAKHPVQGKPLPVARPAPEASPVEEDEPEEPAFGEPTVDAVAGEAATTPNPVPQPSGEAEEVF